MSFSFLYFIWIVFGIAQLQGLNPSSRHNCNIFLSKSFPNGIMFHEKYHCVANGVSDSLSQEKPSARSVDNLLSKPVTCSIPPMANKKTIHSSSNYHLKKFPVGNERVSRFKDEKASNLDATFLGTASCSPSFTRGVSCTALRTNSDYWLFDAGDSSQLQIMKSRLKPHRIRKIFITHLHGDHCFGLAGLLCMIGSADKRNFKKRPKPTTITTTTTKVAQQSRENVVDIYGPEGLRDYIRAVIQLSHSKVVVPWRVHELRDVHFRHTATHNKAPRKQLPKVVTQFSKMYGERPGGRQIEPSDLGVYDLFDESGFTVQAAPMKHTIPCVGYVVTEHNVSGKLNSELVGKLTREYESHLKIDPRVKFKPKNLGSVLSALQHKEQFVLLNGIALNRSDVSEPAVKGRKVVILGDTSNCSMIKDIAMDADLLVHEATNAWFEPTDRNPDYRTLEMSTVSHGHSTPEMAGDFAAQIRAKRLVLNHFSQRYAGDSSEKSMQAMWAIEDMARNRMLLGSENSHDCAMKVPPETIIEKDERRKEWENSVVAAWDQLVLSIRR